MTSSILVDFFCQKIKPGILYYDRMDTAKNAISYIISIVEYTSDLPSIAVHI